MKILKIEAAALCAFIICLFVSTYNLDKSCDGIREGILRLHVIAASDSVKDQQIKLLLRDEILLKGKDIFSESKTKADAEEKIKRHLAEIRKDAESFLKKIGYPYRIKISLEKSFFPTRKYESFTLPAGFYDALKIVIGKGEGQNWWCVMFPALCLPAAESADKTLDAILSEQQKEIISSEKYEIRLWFVEKWQKIRSSIMYNN